jgi:hypothetical protein
MSLVGLNLPDPVRVRTTAYAHSRKIAPSTGVARNLYRERTPGKDQLCCRVLRDTPSASWETWARDFWEPDETVQGKGVAA